MKVKTNHKQTKFHAFAMQMKSIVTTYRAENLQWKQEPSVINHKNSFFFSLRVGKICHTFSSNYTSLLEVSWPVASSILASNNLTHPIQTSLEMRFYIALKKKKKPAELLQQQREEIVLLIETN